MHSPSSSELTPRQSASRSDVSGLHVRRDVLGEERGRLAKIDAAVGDAEEVIAKLDLEIRDLQARERDDVERWADQGGHGAPPALRVDERQKLEQARALATADLRSARARREGIEKRLSEIDLELRDIGVHIRRHRVNAVMAEARDLADEINARAADLRTPWIRLRALDQVLVTEIAAAATRDDRAHAQHLSEIKAEFDRRQEPNLNWDRASLDTAAAAWRERIR